MASYLGVQDKRFFAAVGEGFAWINNFSVSRPLLLSPFPFKCFDIPLFTGKFHPEQIDFIFRKLLAIPFSFYLFQGISLPALLDYLEFNHVHAVFFEFKRGKIAAKHGSRSKPFSSPTLFFLRDVLFLYLAVYIFLH